MSRVVAVPCLVRYEAIRLHGSPWAAPSRGTVGCHLLTPKRSLLGATGSIYLQYVCGYFYRFHLGLLVTRVFQTRHFSPAKRQNVCNRPIVHNQWIQWIQATRTNHFCCPCVAPDHLLLSGPRKSLQGQEWSVAVRNSGKDTIKANDWGLWKRMLCICFYVFLCCQCNRTDVRMGLRCNFPSEKEMIEAAMPIRSSMFQYKWTVPFRKTYCGGVANVGKNSFGYSSMTECHFLTSRVRKSRLGNAEMSSFESRVFTCQNQMESDLMMFDDQLTTHPNSSSTSTLRVRGSSPVPCIHGANVQAMPKIARIDQADGEAPAFDLII